MRIGTRVRLTGPGERTITVLGPWESKPEEDVISYESDFAKDILGRRPGDEVILNGESWRVEKIEPFQ